MTKSSFPWHARPGLAGGIDTDGPPAPEPPENRHPP